jgi:hypothetical protein
MVAINLSDAFHIVAINGHQVAPDALSCQSTSMGSIKIKSHEQLCGIEVIQQLIPVVDSQLA